MYKNLLSGIKLRSLELKNRVVMPAMATHLNAMDGSCTDRLVAYHAERARGGCGLNTLECCAVHTPSAPPTFASLSEDKFIEGYKKLTDAIHEAGGKACVQLWQGGIVASSPVTITVVPSDYTVPETCLFSAGITYKAASLELIHECEKAFGDAARRAVEAGFDTVEFHAAHNYSPHSFLSPHFNKRTDEYGGTFEKRALYPLNCIREIRKNIPEDMPLIMRIDAHDDYLEDGLTIEDIIEFIKLAKKEGVDAVNISRGNVVSYGMIYEVPAIDLPKGFNVDNAARIRKEADIVTIATGRINDPEQAESIVAEGKADMVNLGRAQICDPNFVNKMAAGKTKDIVKCIGCNQGCYEYYFDLTKPHLSCMRNPRVGEEEQINITKTENQKTVVVAGGGMAGLEAAMILKQRGHNPILAEASDHLGGQFILAGAAPRKQEMKEAALSRAEQVVDAGVDVRLNTCVNKEFLENVAPDAVICAIGASPAVLNVPGNCGNHVYNTEEVLSGKRVPQGDTVVIGGGLVGLEVAEYLADKGNKVTVVEMAERIAKDIGVGRNMNIEMALKETDIQSIVNAKCKEIKEGAVVVDTPEGEKEIAAESIVVAIGSKSNDSSEIIKYCEEKNIPCHIVGDAKQARRALDAIHEGFHAALNLE